MERKPLMATAKGGGDFTPASAGPHAAICIDVVARGLQMTKFGAKDKVWLIWAIDEDTEDGKPQIVLQQYTNSLHEKSTMGRHLAAWRGKAFTAEERAGFDLENLIGHKCLLNIVHNESGDRIYANVDSIMKLPKNMTAPEMPEDYERHIDRNPSKDYRSNYYSEDSNPVASLGERREAAKQEAEAAFADDDLPF